MNILTLILLNIAFFICNIYPKHILELNSPRSIFAVLINLLYYAVFALFLLQAFRKGKDLFGENLFSPFKKGNRKTELTRILLILAVQIVLDFIILCLKPVLNEYVFYAIDLLTVAAWVIFYFICATKETNIFRRRRAYLPVLILVLFFAGAAYGNYRLWAEFFSVTDQYYALSTEVLQTAQNTDFLFELKNFFLDTVCGSFLLGAHYILNRSERGKRASIGVQLIRGLVLILGVWLAVATKYWVFPYSNIYTTEGNTSEHRNYEASDNPFDAITATYTYTRIGEGVAKPVYKSTNSKIYYQGSVLLEYGAINHNCNFETKTAGDVTFFLYGKEAICFILDKKPILIHAKEKPGPESDAMTAIYKGLVEENNWTFFEQGAKYLLEHDREFIEPYLERFSSGEFKEEELETLEEMFIKGSYIQYVSRELCNTR